MDDHRHLRVGSEERQAALDALAAHFAAGRLDSFEYEDRRGRATDAVTRGDLMDLFTDLPALDRDGHVIERRSSAVVPRPRRSPTQLIMALVPFVAVGLFLTTGRWWWFFVIPVAGVVTHYIEGDR